MQGNALERLPVLIRDLKQDSEVVALYSFGGAAKNELKPLSDLDYAILLSGQFSKRQRFEKHLEQEQKGAFCKGLFAKRSGKLKI